MYTYHCPLAGNVGVRVVLPGFSTELNESGVHVIRFRFFCAYHDLGNELSCRALI